MPDGQRTHPNGPGVLRRPRHDPRLGDRPAVAGQERSLGELIGAVSTDLSLLMRQEVALAKAEMSEKAAVAGKAGAKIVGGGLLAYVGTLALTAALIAGLAAIGVAVWLSALIVGVVYAVVGGLVLQSGLTALKRDPPKPERTVQTLRDDVNWAKEQLR